MIFSSEKKLYYNNFKLKNNVVVLTIQTWGNEEDKIQSMVCGGFFRAVGDTLGYSTGQTVNAWRRAQWCQVRTLLG